jgi:hypothetical protein
MRYVPLVSSKRTRPKKTAPITGVASGSLGTGANLDETQVLRTADLKAAAPAWFDGDAPDLATDSGAIPAEDLALLGAAKPSPVPAPASSEAHAEHDAAHQTPAAPDVATAVHPRPRIQPQPPERTRGSANRRVPALAGVAVLVALLVVAGAGFFSQLDLGSVGAPGGIQSGSPSFGQVVEASPAATPEPQAAGKGHKCKGKGHGNNCED